MPFGYLISVGVTATYTLIALAPPRPRTSSPFRLSFWLGFLVNELPFVALYVLVASTALAVVQSGAESPVFWAAFGLAILTAAGLVLIVGRALRTRSGCRPRPVPGPRLGLAGSGGKFARRSTPPPPPARRHLRCAFPDPRSPGGASSEYPLRRSRAGEPARSVPSSLTPFRGPDAHPSARGSIRHGQEES
jgi:hypothetical protein